jgi:hypothetical protein
MLVNFVYRSIQGDGSAAGGPSEGFCLAVDESTCSIRVCA